MKLIFIYIATIIIVLIPPALLFTPLILNYNKTGKNTFILGKDYSSLSREEVDKKIDQDFSLPQSLTLKSTTKEYELKLSSISAEINKNKLAGTVLYRRLSKGLIPYIKYFFAPKNFTLEISYDNNSLDKFLLDLSSQINKPFIPSELNLTRNDLTYQKGELGKEIDVPVLKQTIINTLASGQFNNNLDIPLKIIGSIPSDDQISQTKIRARNLIKKSLILTTEFSKVSIDDKTLISWLGFNNDFDQTAIREFSQNTSENVKRDPVDAVFKFENGKVVDFRSSANGIIPQESELSEQIQKNIEQLISSDQNSLLTAIPVKTIEPAIKNGDVNNLGIKELLGRGTSTFKHSNTTRNFNIQKGASIINRILVAPNETFSFIKNLGEVTLDSGFKKAYIIREGKTELDVGGGICQVSTTLFRAMLNAGVDIIQRQAHAYRVSYYEEDSPPGFDATVFIPSPDLKFINDTGHYILIQNTFDGVNKVLTYEIYGTSDGRKVEISNYKKWGAQPAPPARYIDDPTLPPGKIIQDEHSIPGLKTAFDWKVTRNGETLHQKTFQSVFVPWAAVYRRGI